MKILINRLMALIEDNEAPRKIKYKGNIYEYDENDSIYLFSNLFKKATNFFINDEVVESNE